MVRIMKNFFNKFKSYSFWVSLSGALIVLAGALGRAFGFKIENQIIEDCIMSVAGVLIVLGIVVGGGKSKDSEDDEGSAQKKEDSASDANKDSKGDKKDGE